jgi:hypothetical protein
MDFVGFTSSGLSYTNWVGFRENLPGWLDRLIGEQRILPDRGCHLTPSRNLKGSSVPSLLHAQLVAARDVLGKEGARR